MFVERQLMISKKGRYHELQELLGKWAKDFPFPRATAVRHYFTYAGQNFLAIAREFDFPSLDDVQKAWEEWEEMAEDMKPYIEKFEELVDEQMGPELWRVEKAQ